MVFERVGGIVGCAKRAHIEALQNALRAQFRRLQLFIRRVPDARRALFVEEFSDAEKARKLQVRPSVKRVAQRFGNGCGPHQKFVARGRIAGAKSFFDAVRPHRAPFVVVAAQPNFRQIRELAIRCDVTRRQVIVIIEDRFVFRVFVEQLARGVALQQKIVVDERHDLRVARFYPFSAKANASLMVMETTNK